MSRPPLAGDRGAAVRHAQRASGQVAALAGMIVAGDRFPDIAQQLLAARGSLDSLLVRLIELELRDCLPASEVRDEVDGLLWTALGRAPRSRRANRLRGGRRSAPPSSQDHEQRREERTGS